MIAAWGAAPATAIGTWGRCETNADESRLASRVGHATIEPFTYDIEPGLRFLTVNCCPKPGIHWAAGAIVEFGELLCGMGFGHLEIRCL